MPAVDPSKCSAGCQRPQGSSTEGQSGGPRSLPTRTLLLARQFGSFRNLGYLVWGPYNKDPSIWGTILRVPYFRKPPFLSKRGKPFRMTRPIRLPVTDHTLWHKLLYKTASCEQWDLASKTVASLGCMSFTIWSDQVTRLPAGAGSCVHHLGQSARLISKPYPKP